MKRLLILFLLFPFIAMSQNNTVIEPKVNANTVNGIAYPLTDGTADQIIKTDGNGTLTWVTNPAFVGVLGVDASNLAQVEFFRVSDTIKESFSHVHNEYRLTAETISTVDVSNPPTDAELDAAFGTPATVGKGYVIHINDNGAGANFYRVVSDSTNWWVFTGTKAL